MGSVRTQRTKEPGHSVPRTLPHWRPFLSPEYPSSPLKLKIAGQVIFKWITSRLEGVLFLRQSLETRASGRGERRGSTDPRNDGQRRYGSSRRSRALWARADTAPPPVSTRCCAYRRSPGKEGEPKAGGPGPHSHVCPPPHISRPLYFHRSSSLPCISPARDAHTSRVLTSHCPRLVGRGQQLLAVPPPVEDFAAQEEPPSSRHLLTNSPQSDGSSFVAAAPATRDAPYPVPTREERLSRQSSPVPQDPTSPLARTGGVGLSAEDLMEPSPPWAAPTPQPRSMQQCTRPRTRRASLSSTRLPLTHSGYQLFSS